MNHALLPVMLNRFISLYYNSIYDIIFTKLNIFLICLLVHVISFVTVVLPLNFVFNSQFGRKYFLCASFYTDTADYNFLRSMYTTVLLCFYELLIFGFFIMGIAVWKKIKEREKLQLSFDQREALNRTKELLYATMIQATGPLILQTPMVIISILEISKLQNNIPPSLWTITIMLLLTNPLLDAYATVIIVKKYRQAAIKLWLTATQLFKKCNNVVQPEANNEVQG